MKKRMLALVLALVMLVSVTPAALAEDAVAVAKIGDTKYTDIDTAIAKAEDGDTIELLANCETAGMELSKDLIIDGGEKTKYTLTFKGNGITLNGKSLTFKNCSVEMIGICSPFKEKKDEEDWMTIIAKYNASLTLENTEMVMDLNNAKSDSTNGGATHAIYCIGNNTLNLTNSRLTIKNYNQDALEWDGGNGGYNVNFTNSEFVSDHNRSGFTGDFWVTAENSSVKVVNSLGNGSNGCMFKAVNSDINFSNNGSLGLSVYAVDAKNSTFNLRNNGNAGLVIRKTATDNYSSTFDKDTKVYIENNCEKAFAGYGAFLVGGPTTFEAGSVLSVTNNHASGIRVAEGWVSQWVDGNDAALVVEDGAHITVTNNNAHRENTSDYAKAYGGDAYGGGIWTNAKVELPADAVIYNNHAASAGDDIYVSTKKAEKVNNSTANSVDANPSITFGDVGEDWVLDDCNHMIDGWYEDGLEGETPLRWNVHDTAATKHFVKKTSGKYTEAIAYKAAHGEDFHEPGENPIADYILPALWLNTKDHYSYLIGYADGTVRPEGKITRAEVATIFFRLLTDDARAKFWMSTNNYTDVPADKWYNNAISTLSNMGVISGYSDGTFKPDAPISRAEFAKIAVSFSNVADLSYRGYFADVKESDWFSGFVAAAKDAGLIEGYNDGTFQPEKAITRAEVCTIVNRALGRKPSASHMKISDRIDWPDVSVTDWYYEAIMEATNSHTYQMGKLIETWIDKLPQRDWALLETGWANAYTGNGGEVN